jgi:hypothetical protein
MTPFTRKKLIARRQRPRTMGSLSSGGMGSLGDDLATNIAAAASVAAEVSSDPYLAEMLCHVKQLGQIERGQPVQSCFETPVLNGPPGGVGLRYAVWPARGFVYARQHPLAWILGAAVVVGLPMIAGYAIGRSKG